MGPIPTRRFRIYVGYPDDLLESDPLILTEATNVLLSIADIANFTQYIEKGFWNRIGETAIVFEIISSDPLMPIQIRTAALALKTMPGGQQEAVLITTDLIESYVI